MKKLYVLASMLSTLAVVLLFVATPSQATDSATTKWRVINYWSEWCAPCRVEIPMFNELSQAFSGSGISIEGVNFDEDPRAVTLQIAQEMGIGFPVLTQEEVEKLGLRPPDVLPTTYILSGSNEVVAKLIGQQTQQDIVEQLIKLGVKDIPEFDHEH